MATLAVYGSVSAPALNSEPLIVRGDDVVDIRSARYVQDGSIIVQENGTLTFSDTKLVMYQVYRSHHVEVNGTARLILERSDLHYISDRYDTFPGPTIYVK